MCGCASLGKKKEHSWNQPKRASLSVGTGCSSWKDLISMSVSGCFHYPLHVCSPTPPLCWACAIHSLPHAPVKVYDMMTYFPDYPSREKLRFQILDGCSTRASAVIHSQGLLDPESRFTKVVPVQIDSILDLLPTLTKPWVTLHITKQSDHFTVEGPSNLVSAPQISLTRRHSTCIRHHSAMTTPFLSSASTSSLIDFKNISPPS